MSLYSPLKKLRTPSPAVKRKKEYNEDVKKARKQVCSNVFSVVYLLVLSKKKLHRYEGLERHLPEVTLETTGMGMDPLIFS